jgi:hypothetical protein
VALAPAARRVPSGLFLFGSAVVILLAGVLAGLLLAKVASHDAFGRADNNVDRWFAGHSTNDLNRATTTPLTPPNPNDRGLAVLTVAGAALPGGAGVSRCWWWSRRPARCRSSWRSRCWSTGPPLGEALGRGTAHLRLPVRPHRPRGRSGWHLGPACLAAVTVGAAARATDPARDRGPDRSRAVARVPGHALPHRRARGRAVGGQAGWWSGDGPYRAEQHDTRSTPDLHEQPVLPGCLVSWRLRWSAKGSQQAEPWLPWPIQLPKRSKP